MSGLYALLVLGIWAVLTAVIVRGWRRLLAREDVPKLRVHAVFVPLMACWLGVAFWYGGGRKVYYDAQVNRLCRVDGGVKVYETVKLPAERFDQWGSVQIPSKEKAKADDAYYIEWEISYLKKGNPSLWRSHHRVIRKSDGKLLGESIMYARGGGDLPGPWHGSSFKCPEPTQGPSLESAVFLKGEQK